MVELWDLTSKNPSAFALQLPGHASPVTALAFRQDGRWLVAGAQDGTIRGYLIEEEDLRRKAAELATRNLTHDEWAAFQGKTPYHRTFDHLPEGN